MNLYVFTHHGQVTIVRAESADQARQLMAASYHLCHPPEYYADFTVIPPDGPPGVVLDLTA